MKFLQLQLKNFGPYKGSQRLSFPTNEQGRVMAIFGDNMRGKTSLLNAIHWVLYGRALDRNMNEIDLSDLVNYEAQDEGDWSLEVRLEFESNGSTYELRRVANPHELVTKPGSTGDFGVTAYLRKDGHVVKAEEIDDHVNRFIPEDVSRFYLFDGELLQEYEALVQEESRRSKKIKESIEQVLGVPALTHGRDDLKRLLKSAQKLQTQEMKHVETVQSHLAQQARYRSEVETHREDLQELRGRDKSYAESLTQVDKDLDRTEAIRETQHELKSIEADQERIKSQIDDLKKDRAQALEEAWKDLLQPRLQVHAERVSQAIDGYKEQVEEIGAKKERLRTFRELLDNNSCPVCDNHTIEEDRRRAISEQCADLEFEIEKLERKTRDIGGMGHKLKSLRRLQSTGALKEVQRIEKALQKVQTQLVQKEGRAEDLNEELRNHDTSRIAGLQRKKENLLKLRGEVESRIEGLEALVETKDAKIRELSKFISKNPETRKQRSSRLVSIYDGLEQIFSESISELRDRLRERVADAATKAFRQITTQEGYDRLEINDNYGLSIVDKNERVVSLRSAGAEQVVALSLLSALNQTVDRSGPVVIDTPFGRLDPKHRLNILKYVPQMAEQVVFLVHAGEIDPVSGLDPIAEHVGATYEIEEVSESHSRLQKKTQE